MRSRLSGFTRLEFVIVLACVLGLAAIMIPAAQRELAFGRNAITHARIDPAARALRKALRDVRLKPVEVGHGWFAGPGVLPRVPWQGAPWNLADFALAAQPKEFDGLTRGAWHGPYSVDLGPDEFGRAIVVSPVGDPARIVWCISAGRNGIVETTPADIEPQGDDVAVRIR